MEENAQLRAEKMLLTTNTAATSSTTSTINSDTNMTHYAMYVENRPSSKSLTTEELSLYSTVKNKKTPNSSQAQHHSTHIAETTSVENKKTFYQDRYVTNNTR